MLLLKVYGFHNDVGFLFLSLFLIGSVRNQGLVIGLSSQWFQLDIIIGCFHGNKIKCFVEILYDVLGSLNNDNVRLRRVGGTSHGGDAFEKCFIGHL